jgi:hypothetical protein
MWIAYLGWAWRWTSFWYQYNSGGSGRYAVQQLLFGWSVKGTTLLGLATVAGDEFSRLRRWRRQPTAKAEGDAPPQRVLTLVRIAPSANAESARLADQMIGEWEVTSSYINGESVFMPNPWRMHVYRFYIGAPAPTTEEPFGRQEWTIDGSRHPAFVDVRAIYASSTTPANAQPGVLMVDGDRMERCEAVGRDAPRPAGFDHKHTKGFGAVSWRRLK